MFDKRVSLQSKVAAPIRRLVNGVIRNYVLTSVLAAMSFVVVVICLLHYGDILQYNFQPGYGAHLVGLGRHQPWLQSLVQYDSGHYLRIAQQGYQQLLDAAFLPLFPLTVRYLQHVSGSYAIAGLLSAWLALGAAVIVLYKWVQFELSQRKITLCPWLPIGLIAIFPTAFYFAIPYTESLFLLVNIGALYAFRRGNYALAALCSALASMTKYQGAVLAVYYVADLWLSKKRDYRKLLPVAGTLAGFGSYMFFLYLRYGSALEFLTAQKEWGRLHGSLIGNFATSFRPEYFWFLPVLIVGLRTVYEHLGKPYFWYSLAFILLPLSSGRLDALDRYMVSLAPLFLGLAIAYAKSDRTIHKIAYLGGSFFLAGWFILLYANGYLVA